MKSEQKIPMEYPKPIRRVNAADLGIFAPENVRFYSAVATKPKCNELDPSKKPVHHSEIRSKQGKAKARLDLMENAKSKFGIDFGLSFDASPKKAGKAAILEQDDENDSVHHSKTKPFAIIPLDKDGSEGKDEIVDSSTKQSIEGPPRPSLPAKIPPRLMAVTEKINMADVLKSFKNPSNQQQPGLNKNTDNFDDLDLSYGSLNDSLDDIPRTKPFEKNGSLFWLMSYH